MRGLGRFGCIAWVVLVFGVLTGTSQADQSGGAQGYRAEVTIRLLSHFRDGKASNSAAAGDDLGTGETARLFVAAGRVEPPEVCTVQSATGVLPSAMEARALFIWSFDVRMVEVSMGRISFDLSWDRASKVTPAVRESMRVTVREGGVVPLDLVHGQPDGNCASVLVEVSAAIVEDRALENKIIEWDIWWTPSAQSQPIQMRVSSRQGEEAAFEFEPQELVSEQSRAVNVTTSIRVFGQLRGRVRPDGRIDVALTTQRATGMRVGGGTPRRPRAASRTAAQGMGGAGQKFFTVQPDEAIRIVLPPLSSSRVQVATDPTTGQQRVTIKPSGQPPPMTETASEMSLVVRARVR